MDYEPGQNEAFKVETLSTWLNFRIHTFLYERRIKKILREPWDMVHCWEEPYIFAGWQICKNTPSKVPLAIFTAQNIEKRYPFPFSRIERYCLNRCAGWMPVGQTTLEAQLKRGYGIRPQRVIPLGVDLEIFFPSVAARAATLNQLSWPQEGPPILGYLGRFTEEKGIHTLCNALDSVKSPWRALFVGSGPFETQLREWAKQFGDRIRIVTGVPHDRVPAHLNAMDLLCAPSETRPFWKEQFGRMVTEAFACGVPVIGSNSGEIPHVISDAGCIVAEGDVKAWAACIEDLLESPAKRKSYSEKGLERARTVFSWSKVAQNTLSFFEELMQRKN